MTKLTPLLSISLLALLSFSEVFAQTTMDVEFRPRTEFRQGFRKPLADSLSAGLVTVQRTRFNVDYKGKILQARLSFQDARIWGNSDNKTNASKIEMYEAWFDYLLASGLSVQVGRQPLKYDDQRLFAAPSWSNTGTSHDVMVLKYSSPFVHAHAGFAYNNSKDTLMNVGYAFTPKQTYKSMTYVWLSRQVFSGTSLSLIAVYEGFEYKSMYQTVHPRVTYGGNLVYANDSSALGATLTAYGQQGKDPNNVFGKGYADLNSFFLAAKASYKWTKQLTAQGGLDYYSGSEATLEAGKSNTFNRLYGATHNYNGNMEYFATLPKQGLLDYYFGFSAKITPKFTVDVTGHQFYFDKTYVSNQIKTDKNLGTEADLVLNYVTSKEISIQGGFSQYLNSGTTAKYFKMNNVKLYPQQWCYVMLTIRPQLYKTPPTMENN